MTAESVPTMMGFKGKGPKLRMTGGRSSDCGNNNTENHGLNGIIHVYFDVIKFERGLPE